MIQQARFWSIRFGALTLFAIAFLSIVQCTSKGKSRDVDAKEADGLVRNRLAVLVDVREADEVKASGIAQGALWFPTSKVKENGADWAKFKETLPKDKMVVLYCAAGGRAGSIAKDLAAQGYQTGNMGGFSDWQKAGLPSQPFAGVP
jgi:rhodanese-related sulfurtransferase